jgi:hypothetical protein
MPHRLMKPPSSPRNIQIPKPWFRQWASFRSRNSRVSSALIGSAPNAASTTHVAMQCVEIVEIRFG